jgi:glycerol-3-phosphate dehydrogenase
MVIIGGGSTGVGIAVDAASRGYEVLLLEQSDFGKGTSSRSTKLVHGGVRYLQQGNVSLVMEALHERGVLRENAPHLVRDLRFIVPTYDWWESPFYGMGLKIYDLLARKYSFGSSRRLQREEVLAAIPSLRTDGLRGGVQYHDGQFDDARLLINLVQTAARQGATLLNYAPVVHLSKDRFGYLTGVVAHDLESGLEVEVQARAVINATGPFVDQVRRLDDVRAAPMITPSQGVHLVLDRDFLPGDTAIMVPHTPDGRVMFAIPWHQRALVGTTDTPIPGVSLEPRAKSEEVEMILETARQSLARAPLESDVLSAFAGIRPLVANGAAGSTAALSREHAIHISESGLLTVAGGKWTTYRRMAEDCVSQAATLAGLKDKACSTRKMNIHGFHRHSDKFGEHFFYGSDAPAVQDLIRSDPRFEIRLHRDLPIQVGQVLWAVRHEMARTVDDFLARRTRALLLNARAAQDAAPEVARWMAHELGHDQDWQREQVAAFSKVACNYLL